MTHTNHRRRSWLMRLASVAVIAVTAWTPGTLADDAVDISSMAGQGLFERILDELTTIGAEDDARLVDLISDLRRYRQHNLEHRQQRLDALTAALDKMTGETEAGDLMVALVSAIDAHSQSLDPQTLLTDPRIVDLVRQAKEAALTAATESDWLEVLNLYRRLHLLYEPRSPYRDELKMAEQRVRILATYAPRRLQELHLERLKRLGKPVPENSVQEFEPWQQMVKDIRIAILSDVFDDSDRHVTSPSPKQLMLGALDQLLLLTELPDLAVTFEKLGDREQVDEFARYISKLRENFAERRTHISQREVRRRLQGIIQHNERTIGLPKEVLIYEMGEGAVATLDKFSEVIWPYKLEQFKRTTQGNFTGVGIKIEMTEDRRIRVVSPIANTPAHRQGIRSNDHIVEVDGQSTEYWSLDKAVRQITGPSGTQVELGIERKDRAEVLRFKLRRARIPIASVLGWGPLSNGKWNFYIDREAKIGYVRMTQFIPRTADDLDKAIETMRDDVGVSALILDLRGNPGGLLQQAIEVANRFIPSGTIVSTVDKNDRRTQKYTGRTHKTHPRMEVVVLVNRTSASASEIVAGALQDYGKAVITGSRTYGKGSVQDLYPLGGNDAVLRLTTQYYKLPAGRIIHREPDDTEWGVDPDLEVPMTDQQVVDLIMLRQEIDILPDAEADDAEQARPQARQILDKGKDPQLAAALLVIKTRLLAHQIQLAMAEDTVATP